MPKFFTIEEANRTLPLVRRIVSDIVATHRQLLGRIDEYRGLDPSTAEGGRRRAVLEQEMRDLTDKVNAFIAELEEIGALFKGFEEGLVDFYGTLDGRPIFLCWKLDEESVEWWHEIEGGFAGRQRLPVHLLSLGGSE
jgi:hypothetical protein